MFDRRISDRWIPWMLTCMYLFSMASVKALLTITMRRHRVHFSRMVLRIMAWLQELPRCSMVVVAAMAAVAGSACASTNRPLSFDRGCGILMEQYRCATIWLAFSGRSDPTLPYTFLPLRMKTRLFGGVFGFDGNSSSAGCG